MRGRFRTAPVATEKHGAYAVSGALAEKWTELGREAAIGFPIADETPAADGGRLASFEADKAIDWHPDTGAHLVSGPILTAWLANGGSAGGLGHAISDDYPHATGRRSDFQHGYVLWSSENGTTVTVMHERCVECKDGSAQCGTEELCLPH